MNIDIQEHFPFITNKYVILYIDEDNYDYQNKLSQILKDTYNLIVIKFLLNSEIKTQCPDNVIEIYPDEYTEDTLISQCQFILYFSQKERSGILANLSEKYSKAIIVDDTNLLEIIGLLMNLENVDKETLDNAREDYLKHIKNIENKNSTILPKNINLDYKKIIDNQSDNKYKINIVTFYNHHEENIINIIQKKCIVENLKNKFVGNVYVIGNDIMNKINDINESVNDAERTNLKLVEHSNSSFQNILEFINYHLTDKIVCLLRSDIVLLNHVDLDDIHNELFNSMGKDVFTLSRIDRLINGEFIKNQKLNQLLFSTEQDAWIFKSPLSSEFNELKNTGFYDKYGELYFNNVLKNNGYNLINSNKYKIIRVLYENNLDTRLIMNNIDLKGDVLKNESILNEITLVPDNSIDNIPLEQLIKVFNINDKELYKIKCELFNKYYKKKVVNEIK